MEPILCTNVCVAIDTMLNFDGDANAVVEQEQTFIVIKALFTRNVCILRLRQTLRMESIATSDVFTHNAITFAS